MPAPSTWQPRGAARLLSPVLLVSCGCNAFLASAPATSAVVAKAPSPWTPSAPSSAPQASRAAHGAAAAAGGGRGGRGSPRRRLESVGSVRAAAGTGTEGIPELDRMNSPHIAGVGGVFSLQLGVMEREPTDVFTCDPRVVLGINALEIGLVELDGLGLKRPFIVTGWNQARADSIVWEIYPRGQEMEWHNVQTEPTALCITEGADKALRHEADYVLAIGGAGIIDAAKLIASLAYASHDHKDALKRLVSNARHPRSALKSKEVEGVVVSPLPLVTVPLVPGCGAEVTSVANFLYDPFDDCTTTVGWGNTAAAMPAPFMALCEPALSLRLPLEEAWPRAVVAFAGCLEAFLDGRGFMEDMMAHQGLTRLSTCLTQELTLTGASYEQKEAIAYGSVLCGLTRSKKGWGLLHMVAEAVSSVAGTPYSSTVARLLPRMIEEHLSVLQAEVSGASTPTPTPTPTTTTTTSATSSSSPSSSTSTALAPVVSPTAVPLSTATAATTTATDASRAAASASAAVASEAQLSLLRYKRACALITGDGAVGAEALVQWVDAMVAEKGILPLGRQGFREQDVEAVMAAVATQREEGKIVGHPFRVGDAALRKALQGELCESASVVSPPQLPFQE